METLSEANRVARWRQCMRASLLLMGLACLLTACVAPNKYTPASTYIPSAQLEPAGTTTLPIKVQMIRLIDASPSEDKNDGWLYGSGWSLTSPEKLNGDLSALITEAITKDFQSHGMFQSLTQDQREPMRLGGKIHKFTQRRQQYLWVFCCGLLGVLLPFPVMKEEGEVDLELTLSRGADRLIRSYRGHASFLKRCNFYEGRCWESYNMSPATYLDQALADALRQIREAILQDREFIAHQVLSQDSKSH